MSSWSSLLQLLFNTNTLQTQNHPQLHIRKQTSMLDRISGVIGSAGRWGSLMKTAEWAFQVARFLDVYQLWKQTLKRLMQKYMLRLQRAQACCPVICCFKSLFIQKYEEQTYRLMIIAVRCNKNGFLKADRLQRW